MLPGIQPLLEIPRLKPWTSQTVHLSAFLMIETMPLAETKASPKIESHYLKALVWRMVCFREGEPAVNERNT